MDEWCAVFAAIDLAAQKTGLWTLAALWWLMLALLWNHFVAFFSVEFRWRSKNELLSGPAMADWIRGLACAVAMLWASSRLVASFRRLNLPCATTLMTESSFRKLLWLYVALMIAGVVATYYPPHSSELKAALARDFQGSWQTHNVLGAMALLHLLLGSWLAGLIGLFLLKWWGRPVALFATLAGFTSAAFNGSSLQWGLESGLSQAAMCLWGAILGAAYFTPLSDLFQRPRSAPIVAE